MCDGSQLVHAYLGTLQSGFGKVMASFFFQPTGVSSYYLAMLKALNIPLGPPKNLVLADGGAGGNFLAGTYGYVVTALDGAGGETTISNEVFITIAASHQIIVTWNIVPNAVGYNIYRTALGGGSGTEVLLLAPNLPVPQPGAGTLTATFTDTNSAAVPTYPVLSINWSAFNPPTFGQFGIFHFSSPTIPVNVGDTINYVPGSFSPFGGTWIVQSITTVLGVNSYNCFPTGGQPYGSFANGTNSTGGYAFVPASLPTGAVTPPTVDNTQQCALYKMPVIAGSPANLPVSYNLNNIVALFPADLPKNPGGGGGGGGGSGGGGGTGGGGSTGSGGGTPSGGILGNISFIPDIVQFTNRAILALGNGYPPQIFSDPTTSINPATISTISAMSIDAFGVVTIQTATPHGLTSTQVGGNVVIFSPGNAFFNGAFPTISIPDTTHLKVRNLNAIGQTAVAPLGTVTTTSVPITSTFVPAFAAWAATTNYITGDIIVPTTQPATPIYLTCLQSGISGSSEPAWPTGGANAINQQVRETGSSGAPGVVWQVSGLLNSAAPPPPGAAHAKVYAGALWLLNTSPNNTSTGLDGPCSLRQSSVNNPNSWNPINQAFLDKDDGQEGMGLAKFTITAQGIPPQGSLVAFKNYIPYQILGVFGASNFAIQAISSDMGCTAPRTIQFVPGFGIMRFTHLGIAVFNGVTDTLNSEQIRPYLFPTNDESVADITVMDANWSSVSWGAQTANPPQYVLAIPIGNSNGMLTRMCCYDLVLKGWLIVDLPFAISTIAQFKSESANPVTIMGGFSDGALQRWQAGDILWDTGGSGARSPSKVIWAVTAPSVASQNTDQPLYSRRVVFTGNNSGGTGVVSAVIRVSGNAVSAQNRTVLTNGDFDLDFAVGFRGKRFDAIFSSSLHVEIDGITWESESRPAGVVVSI